jgi:hypothetical protein
MQCQRHLPQVVDALGPPTGLAGGLYGRKQQGDQNADDGDHHEQLHQCKGSLSLWGELHKTSEIENDGERMTIKRNEIRTIRAFSEPRSAGMR